MNRIVTYEYKGIKYSVQPHGLKSRFLTVFALFVVAFGGTLLAASPASAASPTDPIPVTVCGNSTDWYVNWDEAGADLKQGDRRPFATNDGLVFGPKNLIHHQLDFTVKSDLVAGTYIASPAPDLPDFFSIEVWDDGVVNYATLRWNSSSGGFWSVTTSSGTHKDIDPVKLLTDNNKSIHARTFGVGYTNTPPGAVTSLVSSISFKGITYNLACPVVPSPSPVVVPFPSPSPVIIPQPIKTVIVIKTQAVPAAPVVEATPSSLVTSPSPSPSLTDSPSPSVSPLPAYVPGDTNIPSPSPASAASQGSSLIGWGVAVAGVGGLALASMGLAGIVKRRRQERYQGEHHVDGSQTQMLPTVPDDYSVSDYDPKVGPLHDLSFPGDSNKGLDETVVQEIPSEILVRRDPFSENQ